MTTELFNASHHLDAGELPADLDNAALSGLLDRAGLSITRLEGLLRRYAKDGPHGLSREQARTALSNSTKEGTDG